jgi:L-ascorbate metabolism protein UlaG (beta-lactamase superfamily)
MAATITWLGHACVRLTLADGRLILIDPWLIDNPACPANLKKPSRCDMVLCTHGHFDHVADVPRLIEAFDPIVVGNYDLCFILEKTIGKGRFNGMNTGGSMDVDGIRVTLTQAFHSSGYDWPGGPSYAGMPNGIVVSVPGLASVYHAGDTDVFGDMKIIAQLFQPKICMLPIGDRVTMGAKGAAMAAELLQPASILPIHYKTFPMLAQSAEEFRNALSPTMRSRLKVAEIGQELAWTAAGIG